MEPSKFTATISFSEDILEVSKAYGYPEKVPGKDEEGGDIQIDNPQSPTDFMVNAFKAYCVKFPLQFESQKIDQEAALQHQAIDQATSASRQAAEEDIANNTIVSLEN